MKRIKFIFVNEHAWWHKPISETILKLSHSDKDFAVHMAIWFSEVDDEIRNAIWKMLYLKPLNRM